LKKINIARREERERIADSIRPGAILGTRPGDQATWRNCDLAKVLIDEHTVKDAEPQIINLSGGTVSILEHLNFGVGEVEKTMLFKHLPTLSAQMDILQDDVHQNTDYVAKKLDNGEKREWQKANVIAKVLDLRNANAKGIAYENRRRIVAEFSGSENPFDTGRPEVQGSSSIPSVFV
jgi:small subunit ribosomal protein S15